MILAAVLPSVNAALNLTSTVLLALGFVAIRRHAVPTHRRLMLGAFAASTLFLAGYLTRFALFGAHHFPEVGWPRAAYLVLLASHTLLAAAALPLVLRTLFLALRGRFGAHRAIARYTWPVWMYVSVTGVVVYVMLYHVAPRLVGG